MAANQPASFQLKNTIRASVDYEASVFKNVLDSVSAQASITSLNPNIVFVERSLEQSYIPVFRWCNLPPSKVFVEGFKSEEQPNTTNHLFYSYSHYMIRRPSHIFRSSHFRSVFVNTFRNDSFKPHPFPQKRQLAYLYKIFAPGGIVAQQTLKEDYKYYSIDEISFIFSIQPCYIHSAEQYVLETNLPPDRRGDNVTKILANEVFYLNSAFSPGPHLDRGKINISHDYKPPYLKHTVFYPPYVPTNYRRYDEDYGRPM